VLTLLKKHLIGYRLISLIGLILKLLEAIIEVFIPLIIALIIDRGLTRGDFSFVLNMGFVMLGLYVLGYILALFCQLFAAKAGFGFLFNLRNSLFAHINSLSTIDSDAFKPESLTMRLNNDTNNAQIAVNRFIRLGTRAPFLLVGALVMALRLHPVMALIIFVAASLISFAIFLIMKRANKGLKDINFGLDEIARQSSETLVGARAIRSFNKQGEINDKFKERADKLKKDSVRFLKVSLLASPLAYLVVNLVIIAILYFGGMFVYSGNLSQGEVVALINYMLQILNALMIIAFMAPIFNRAAASSKRINQVFDTMANSDFKLKTIPEKLAHTDCDLVCKNVSFSYPNRAVPALANIDFVLKSGQTLGIIGTLASGKTTLADLIAGFYDHDGEIENGHSLAYAMQRLQIFSGTIKDNVTMGRTACDKDIKAALALAECDFADNLDAPILPFGVNLSGGQKQRLCLARAFLGVVLKTATLLLLDDVTSALDYGTEKAVMTNINNLDGITKIIISSKAKNIKDADNILVLKNGKIEGYGKHDHLINNCPLYKEIVLLQEEIND